LSGLSVRVSALVGMTAVAVGPTAQSLSLLDRGEAD
jgi:hypothetical protein